jgi:hypothetical protein
MAAAVYPGGGTGLPSPALGWQPLGGALGARRSGSRTSGRKGTPVCAAARGPVNAAADTAAPLGCPRARLGCQAAASGPPSARQRTRRAAAPCLTHPPPRGHSGKHRRRCALPVPLLPLTPTPPHGGSADRYSSCMEAAVSPLLMPVTALRAARGFLSTWYQPASLPLWSFLPLRRLCTVLLEDSYVKVRPSRLRCWRTIVAGMAGARNRRRTRVPDETRAVAGGPCGGNVPPHPSPVAALPR